MQAIGPELSTSLAGQFIGLVSIPRLIAAGINLRSPSAITTWLGSNAPDYVTPSAAALNVQSTSSTPGPRLVWPITGIAAERYFLCYGPSSSGPWTLLVGGDGSPQSRGGNPMPQEVRLGN